MDTVARFAVRITVSSEGSASSPRRRGPAAKPSLTNRIVLRALPRLPRCVASAFNADVAICARSDVVLIEEDGEQPRANVRSFRLFVDARLNGHDRLTRREGSVGLHKLNAVDGAGGAILEDLKILCAEVVNSATARIRDDRV